MKKLIFLSVISFVISIVFTSNFMGENNSRSLCVNGTVYYHGSGYEGATVRLYEGTCSTFIRSTTSASHGGYSINISDLDPGWYTLKATVSCDPDWRYDSTCHSFYFDGTSDSGNEHLYLTKSECISK